MVGGSLQTTSTVDEGGSYTGEVDTNSRDIIYEAIARQQVQDRDLVGAGDGPVAGGSRM